MEPQKPKNGWLEENFPQIGWVLASKYSGIQGVYPNFKNLQGGAPTIVINGVMGHKWPT